MASRPTYAQFPQYQYHKFDNKLLKYTNIPFHTKPKQDEAEDTNQTETKEPGNAEETPPAPDKNPADSATVVDNAEPTETVQGEIEPEQTEVEAPPPPPQEEPSNGQVEVAPEAEVADKDVEASSVEPDPAAEQPEAQADPAPEEAVSIPAPVVESEPVIQDAVDAAPPTGADPVPTTEEAPAAATEATNDEVVPPPAPEVPTSQEKAPAKAKKGKKVQLKVPSKQSAKKADAAEKTEKPKEKAKALAKTKKGAKPDKKKGGKAAVVADAPPPAEDTQSKVEPETKEVEAPAVEEAAAPAVEEAAAPAVEEAAPAVEEAAPAVEEAAAPVVEEAAAPAVKEAAPAVEEAAPAVEEAAAPPVEEAKDEPNTNEAGQQPTEIETPVVVSENSEIGIANADASKPAGTPESEDIAPSTSDEATQSEAVPDTGSEDKPSTDIAEATTFELSPPLAVETGDSVESAAEPQPEALPQASSGTESEPTDGEIAQSEVLPQPPAENESDTDKKTDTQLESLPQFTSGNNNSTETESDPVVVEFVENTGNATENTVESGTEQTDGAQSVIVAEPEAIVNENSESSILDSAKHDSEQVDALDNAPKSSTDTDEAISGQEPETAKEPPSAVQSEPESEQKDEPVAENPSDKITTAEIVQPIETKETLTDQPSVPNNTEITEPHVDLIETTVAEVKEEAKSEAETADVSTNGNEAISNVIPPSTDIDLAPDDQEKSSDTDNKSTSEGLFQETTKATEPETTQTDESEVSGQSASVESDIKEATGPDTTMEADSSVKAIVDVEPSMDANPDTKPNGKPEADVETIHENIAEVKSEIEVTDDTAVTASGSNPEQTSTTSPEESQAKDEPVSDSLDGSKTSLPSTGDSGNTTVTNETAPTNPEDVSEKEADFAKVEEEIMTPVQHSEEVPTSNEQVEAAPNPLTEIDETTSPSQVKDAIESVNVTEVTNEAESTNEVIEASEDAALEKTVEHGDTNHNDASLKLENPEETIETAIKEDAALEEAEPIVKKPDGLAEELPKDTAVVVQPAEEVEEKVVNPVSEDQNLPATNATTKADDVDSRSIAAVCDDPVIEQIQEEAPQEAIPQEVAIEEDPPKELPRDEDEPEAKAVDDAEHIQKTAETVPIDMNLQSSESAKSDHGPEVVGTTEPSNDLESSERDIVADATSHDAVPEVILAPLPSDKEREKRRHKRRSTAERPHRHHETSDSKGKSSEDARGETRKARATHEPKAAEAQSRRHKAVDPVSEKQPHLISRRDYHDTGHVKVQKSQNHHSRPEAERKSSSRPSPPSGETQRPKHQRGEESFRSMKSEQGHEKAGFNLNALGKALRPKLFTGTKAQSEMHKSSRDSASREVPVMQGNSPPTSKSPRSPTESKMQRSYSEQKPSRSEEEAARRLAHTRRREREAKDAATADAARRAARREAHRLEHNKQHRRTDVEKTDRPRRKHADRRDSKGSSSTGPAGDEVAGDSEHGESERGQVPLERTLDQDGQPDQQQHHHRHHHYRTSSHSNTGQDRSLEKEERPEPHRAHRRHSYIGESRKVKGDSHPKDQGKRTESAAPVGLFKRIFGN